MNVFQMLRLPDLVSLLNLICGISSIVLAAQATVQVATSQTMATHNGFSLALILLLIAAIADGVDGYIARRFKGGELGNNWTPWQMLFPSGWLLLFSYTCSSDR